MSVICLICLPCADPEGGGGGRGVRTPLKNHRNIGFSSNTGPDPLKNRSYQASIQCWAIIDTPAKRHLMAFRWRADDGPLIVVLGSSLPSSKKQKKKKQKKKNKKQKKKKNVKSWTPSDKTSRIRACLPPLFRCNYPIFSINENRNNIEQVYHPLQNSDFL